MKAYAARLMTIHLKIAGLRRAAAVMSQRLAADVDEFDQLARADDMHELKWRIREESRQRSSER